MARVKAPATALMVVGATSFVATILAIMVISASGGSYQIQPPDPAATSVSVTPPPAPSTEPYSDDIRFELAILLGVIVVKLGLDALVTVAGARMRGLENRNLGMAGAIVAMLPLSPCVLLGLPIGVWALVVLLNQDVRRSFVS